MNRIEYQKLKPGIYLIHWLEGVNSTSLAAVGVTPEGDRWLAPINWTWPTGSNSRKELKDYWKWVSRVTPIEIDIDSFDNCREFAIDYGHVKGKCHSCGDDATPKRRLCSDCRCPQ